jgi:hypothetical protein
MTRWDVNARATRRVAPTDIEPLLPSNEEINEPMTPWNAPQANPPLTPA